MHIYKAFPVSLIELQIFTIKFKKKQGSLVLGGVKLYLNILITSQSYIYYLIVKSLY